MKSALNPDVAKTYKNTSQRVRVMTENWVAENIFCPNCGTSKVEQFPNNAPAADFFCLTCTEEFELKSSKVARPKKITDGAYNTLIARLNANNNPNFFFLGYNKDSLQISTFFVVPKHFFIPNVIERRKPLSPHAKRAGWVGCNILLQDLPECGKIFFIRESTCLPKASVLANWRRTLFLRDELKTSAKGWTLDIIKCIESLGKRSFTINDIYFFEDALRNKYPNNQHIKAKIRQQLQTLRDKNFLSFTRKGEYELF